MTTAAFLLGFALGCIFGFVAGALWITYGRETPTASGSGLHGDDDHTTVQLVGDGAMRGGEPTTHRRTNR